MSATWGAAFGKGLWNAWDREAQDYRARRQKQKDEERKKQEAIAEEQRLYDLQQQRLAEQREMDNQRALAMNEALYGDAGKTAANAAFAALNSGLVGGLGYQPDGNQIQGIMSEALRRSGLSPELSTGNLMNLDKQILANDALKRQAETDANNQLVRDTNQVKLDMAKKELENYDTDFTNRQNEINSRTAANEALKSERIAGANRENAITSAIKNGSYFSRGGSGGNVPTANIEDMDDMEKQLYNEYVSISKQIENEKARLPYMEKAKNEAERNGSEGYSTASRQYMNRSKNIDNLILQQQQKEQEWLRYRASKNKKNDLKSDKKSGAPATKKESAIDSLSKDINAMVNDTIKGGVDTRQKNALMTKLKVHPEQLTAGDFALARKIYADNPLMLKAIEENVRNNRYMESMKAKPQKDAANEALKNKEQIALEKARLAAEYGR